MKLGLPYMMWTNSDLEQSDLRPTIPSDKQAKTTTKTVFTIQ